MAKSDSNSETRAVMLFSGGLDSILASELLLRSGVEVVLLKHTSVFSPLKSSDGYTPDCPIIIRDISEAMVEMVRDPSYGRGKNANPCLDCKRMMYGLAWQEAERQGARFIATGEVLGQRPMSQRLDAFRLMEKDLPVAGRVVRPLSGKLLPPTEPEKEGLIRREDMLDISGRSRKRQMALAEEWGITDYPTPAGGCKLTDPQYGERVMRLLDAGLLSVENARAARHGRMLDLEGGRFVLVGRNHDDNQALLRDAPDEATVLDLNERPGPLACILGTPTADGLEEAQRRVIEYSRFSNLDTGDVLTMRADEMRASAKPADSAEGG